MRMPTSCPPRISAASRRWGPRQTRPPRETGRSTSIAWPSSTGGSGAGPAGTAPAAASLARSLTDRWERTVLIRAPPADRWISSAVGPEPDHDPGPGGAEPELPPGDPHVPRRRHHPVELHRAALPAGWSWRWALRSRGLCWAIGAAGGGEGGWQPQVDQVPLGGRDRGEPVGRGDRHLAVQGLVRAVSVVLADPGVEGGLGRLHRGEAA